MNHSYVANIYMKPLFSRIDTNGPKSLKHLKHPWSEGKKTLKQIETQFETPWSEGLGV